MKTLITADSLKKRFGKLPAVDGFSLEIRSHEVVGLIGPNGSGKSTVVNLLSGALRPSGGRVFLEGADATTWSPQRRCHWGLGRTRQVARPLSDMTVFDNVLVAALFGHATTQSVKSARRIAESVLEDLGLEEDAAARPGDLTIQRLKLLEMARAMASRPRVLLLDETLAGLTPDEGGRVVELIKEMRARGLGILFIEHRLPDVLALCDRLYVLNAGTLLSHGDPRAVAADPAVMKAYLGIEAPTEAVVDA
jgi:ABC-type branched-subunit amino acid transport system ATPase component